jgi:hypothetical protein
MQMAFWRKPKTHDRIGIAYGDVAIRAVWVLAALGVFAWVWSQL